MNLILTHMPLLHPQPGVLPFPQMERRLPDAQFAANLRCLLARFLLPQRRDDLLFRVSLLCIAPSSSLITEDHAA